MNNLCDYLIEKINSYLLPNEIYLMILNKYTTNLFLDLAKVYNLNSKIFDIFQSTSSFHLLTRTPKNLTTPEEYYYYKNNININSTLSGYARLSLQEYTLVKELTKDIKKHIKISKNLNFKYKSFIYTDIQTHPTTSHICENLYRFHIYLQK